MVKFVKGNEAVVMGALYAGCDLYFGYPITPASEIAHGAAKWFPMLGRTFVQAECETASVNMMFGAAAAGKLCMTATSGPGFSLMQEGISYLAGAELPAVVVNINRAGPGLGNVYPAERLYSRSEGRWPRKLQGVHRSPCERAGDVRPYDSCVPYGD